MTAQHSYDITIQIGEGDELPFGYGQNGGLKLGNALLEPSAPSRVDTIPMQSFHHGMGRLIATDPYMLRDSFGKQIAADVRQPGMVMPGGALTELGRVNVIDDANIALLQAYGGALTIDNGNVSFLAGRQVITIDITDDSLSNIEANIAVDTYFTGSVVQWNTDQWAGVADPTGPATAAYNYTDDTEVTSNTYAFSWAVSTRQAIFWIRNRDNADPEMHWSDRTDQAFGAFNVNFIYPSATNGYVLEVPKSFVTGMGVAGTYALYGTKGGNIWGFDQQEVFKQLTPSNPGGFIDNRFGGPMNYVGSWLLVPNLDGIGRFDPRTIGYTDISPAVHQAATPGISTATKKRAYYASPTPTGAVVAANLLSDGINLLNLEMYEDGMFWHPILLELGADISRVWALIVTHGVDGDGEFTSSLRAYIIASSADYSEWIIYRYDLATAAWSPGPEVMAAESGFRTGFYTTRPPDVLASPTQLRGYVKASDDNPVSLWLEVDNDETDYFLATLTESGPYVVPVPEGVVPGRKFAIAGTLAVTDQDGVIPQIFLPINLDYRYVQKAKHNDPDFFTVVFEAASSDLNKVTSARWSHGRSETEALLELSGQRITLTFADTETPWYAVVESAEAKQIYLEDGRTSTGFMVTLVGRKVG